MLPPFSAGWSARQTPLDRNARETDLRCRSTSASPISRLDSIAGTGLLASKRG